MRVPGEWRVIAHQPHADIDIARPREQPVACTAADVPGRMVVGAAADHPRPRICSVFTAVAGVVGIGPGQAAGPFPDIASHVAAAPGAAPLRVRPHRRGGADLGAEVGMPCRGRRISPGVNAPVVPARGALPFRLAGQACTGATGIRRRRKPVDIRDRVVVQRGTGLRAVPVGWRSGARGRAPAGVLGVGHRRAGDPEAGQHQPLGRRTSIGRLWRAPQGHHARRHRQPDGPVSLRHRRPRRAPA